MESTINPVLSPKVKILSGDLRNITAHAMCVIIENHEKYKAIAVPEKAGQVSFEGGMAAVTDLENMLFDYYMKKGVNLVTEGTTILVNKFIDKIQGNK